MKNERERVAIINFLQWNDKNGCYTDENCDLENIPRMSYSDAVKYFFGVMNDDFYYGITDNIFELSYEETITLAKENGFYNQTIEKLEELVSQKVLKEEFFKKFI